MMDSRCKRMRSSFPSHGWLGCRSPLLVRLGLREAVHVVQVVLCDVRGVRLPFLVATRALAAGERLVLAAAATAAQ